MAFYSNVAAEFSKQGLSDSFREKEYKINGVLDKIAQNNLGVDEFDRALALELFQQTNKLQDNSVLIKDYITVILQAYEFLDKHMNSLREQLKLKNHQENRKQILQGITQYYREMRLLSLCFHLPQPQKFPELENYADLHKVNPDHTTNLQHKPEQPSQNFDLKVVFFITCISLLVELVCAFVKNDFLNLFSLLVVLGIFFLKWFDRLYIRMCLLTLVISLIFDIVWLIVMSGPFWNPRTLTYRPSQPAFFCFVYVAIIILMIVRFIICALLYSHRSNEPDLRKMITIFSLEFELTGNPKTNPLTAMFAKQAEVFGIQ